MRSLTAKIAMAVGVLVGAPAPAKADDRSCRDDPSTARCVGGCRCDFCCLNGSQYCPCRPPRPLRRCEEPWCWYYQRQVGPTHVHVPKCCSPRPQGLPTEDECPCQNQLLSRGEHTR